ncbi:hypothetical protein [Brachybacterium hainanense]|uniref:Uncharacterized protein n=1 Tax=Brachybacterium hainanense TaxID=1541174 RepID=A0ABV6RFC2_9MICO
MSRRTLLTAAGVAAGGVAAGAFVIGRERDPSSPENPAPPPEGPAPGDGWSVRDRRLLVAPPPSTGTLEVLHEYAGAFPALKIRDVLPLEGLGPAGEPWIVATVIGPTNQIQITTSSRPAPEHVLELPPEHRGEILSMAWDAQRKTLYHSASGRLWAWRSAQPTVVVDLGQVPGASALYELLVDPAGLVWGGTFPLGAVFTYDPSTSKFQVHSRVAPDTQYVRRLSMDLRGRIWVGTGSQNPRLFTFLRTSPEDRTEIPLPEPMENGFISAVRAGASKVLVTTDAHPDVLELDIPTLSWDRRFTASTWIRTPSSAIARSDVYYTIADGVLSMNTSAASVPLGELDLEDVSSACLLGTDLHLVSITREGYTASAFSLASRSTAPARSVRLEPGRFRVQSLLAHSDGNVYVGGFMGTGLAGISPDTDQRWSSPAADASIHQVEQMVQFDERVSFLGTYSWADVIRWESTSRDDPSSYSQLVRLSKKYRQSRPYGMAVNSRSLFVGTVPDYGLSGGVLAAIDVETGTPTWVLDGDGAGFIGGHSIIGLTADEEYVYGSTSVRNGSGLPDTDGLAQLFMIDVATQRKIWQTAPVPGAGALYAPTFLGGWLLVADLEGIAVIDPRNGRLEVRHTLTDVPNSSQRPGWASADLVVAGDRVVHAAAGTITIVDFRAGTASRVADAGGRAAFGSRLAASPQGRVFAISQGTDVVEIATAPAPSEPG